MGSSETLFSLELAVESLRVNSSTVVCRMPSVAFRLLDFPTLLLHHVDPEEAPNIKEKIILDRFGEIPSQLQELKDHRGNFCINKCKSSLFKMDLQTLLSYLRNTPLYVMLIDVWPKVPKLVANCTVSLQGVMEEILCDFERNGVDVPSVHGDRDSYKLYNLMGSQVGWIVVRYRMLNMGTSLIPHIPESEITTRSTKSADLSVSPRKSKGGIVVSDTKKGNKDTDVVLEDLEVQGQPKRISVAVSTVDDPGFLPKHAGSEKIQQAPVMQSTKTRNQSSAFERSTQLVTFRNDDIIVNNTHCPPPLYFNTANEDAHVSESSDPQNRLFQSVSRIPRDTEYFPSGRHAEPAGTAERLSDDLSTSSRTPSEDVVHQIEMHYKFPSQEGSAASPGWSVRKTHPALRNENSNSEKEGHPEGRRAKSETGLGLESVPLGSDVCNRCRLTFEPNQRPQLPLLEALLQELSLLHGSAVHNRPTTPSGTPVKVQVHSAVAKTPLTGKEPMSGKENIHSKQPRVVHQGKPYRHKHMECARPPQGVPPTKGWLRQQRPAARAHRSAKLRFGMTNSQRLRLRKNNPELLRAMELRETRTQAEKEKAITLKHHHVVTEADFNDGVDHHDISTEIAHHFEGEYPGLHTHQTQIKLPLGAGSGKSYSPKIEAVDRKGRKEYSDQRNRQTTSPEQPPVPVQRKPKGATYSWAGKPSPRPEDGMGNDHGAATGGIGTSETDDDDVGFHRNRRDSRGSVERRVDADLSSSDKSARSINVYLPMASVHKSDSGSNSDDSTDTDSQFSSASSDDKRPKAIRIPGLPSGQDSFREDVDRSGDLSDMQYSDDFVRSDNLASTGEQELAPLASNQSDSCYSAHPSRSGASRSSSVRTAESQTSQIAGRTPQPLGLRPSGHPANPQTRRLSIPKPKLSSVSPVPVRKTSKASTVSINAAVVTPDPPLETKRPRTPPTPKPRPSLLGSASSFSGNSLLQSTVPSSEFRTEDSLNAGQWTKQEGSSNSYSDDFDNSEPISDHSDTF